MDDQWLSSTLLHCNTQCLLLAPLEYGPGACEDDSANERRARRTFRKLSGEA